MYRPRLMTAGHANVKTRDEDGTRTLSGYAAVFYNADDPGTEYRLGKNVRERIAPGAFDRVLTEGPDVRGQFNHDSNQILARTPDTLRLTVDEVGLRYEMDENPDDPDWQRVMAKVERKDVTGSSFMFTIGTEERQDVEDSDEVIFTITDIRNLYDVGPVTFPAYEAASVELRWDPRFQNLRLDRSRQKHRQRVTRLREITVRQAGQK